MNRGLAATAVAACALGSLLAEAVAAEIDTEHTRIGFTLKTRWGQSLRGQFPRYRGELERLDDGRLRARVTMSAREVEIVGHPSYTEMTRGKGFFEAERYPEVEFVSDPFPPRLLIEGGKLGGHLTLRGIRRHETFNIAEAECARPARDCDAVATGTVRRSGYGVDRWVLAVSDYVRFVLRLRVREDAADADAFPVRDGRDTSEQNPRVERER